MFAVYEALGDVEMLYYALEKCSGSEKKYFMRV